MDTTRQQSDATPLRELKQDETAVLFFIDAAHPPISDDDFDKLFMLLQLTEGVVKGKKLNGFWKAIRVPNLAAHGADEALEALPYAVNEEILAWRSAQRGHAIKVRRTSKAFPLSQSGGFGVLLQKSEKVRRTDIDQIPERIREKLARGETAHLTEAMPWLEANLATNRGPFRYVATDPHTGISVCAEASNWSELRNAPNVSAEAGARSFAELRESAFLAISRKGETISFECPVKYVALTSAYFENYDRFLRRQDIPDRYFRPALRPHNAIGCQMPGGLGGIGTYFVSHRWETLDAPDPQGEQFKILKRVSTQMPDALFWYDYACMPQKPHSPIDAELFAQSLKHLNNLVFATRFFAIVSDYYVNRAWCYYEWLVSYLVAFEGATERTMLYRQGAVDPDDEFYLLVEDLVLRNKVPPLRVGYDSDMPHILRLLGIGVKSFKTYAIGTTLELLNQVGFRFPPSAAVRVAELIDFDVFWLKWQVLAASSEHSGIRLPHLRDRRRLANILKERHERNQTHDRLHSMLNDLCRVPLELDDRGKAQPRPAC